MALLHARKPSHYAATFFSRIKFYHLWKDSLSHYRKSMSNWKSSGTNLSRPLYHFVLPVTIFDPQHPLKTCGLALPTKRWDTIAWYTALQLCLLRSGIYDNKKSFLFLHFSETYHRQSWGL
jgi:beta-glucosidase/6-phospho-beta-glucosidase/beta-galactosidase